MKCEKIGYASAADARRAMHKVLDRSRAKRHGDSSAYHCKECGAWHWGTARGMRKRKIPNVR